MLASPTNVPSAKATSEALDVLRRQELVRLVLVMIVKNEAGQVERCLKSALPHVDGFVIADTGSVDGTRAVIETVAAELDKPGKVVEHEWRDFGHNRTRVVEEARRWVAGAGWPAERVYLLFLDADMTLEVDHSFDKQALDATYYDVFQDDGALSYANTRLACLSHDWVAVGVTHEYWKPSGPRVEAGQLETLRVRDIGDGGSKTDKFERDLRLLESGLASEPDNARYAFYLAQTYFDLGRFAEAAAAYARRHALGGWDEERWYARYREGLSLLQSGETERGAGVLLAAFDERPTRAEPLRALARHYRERSQNQVAYMLARRGLEVPYPRDEVLFVERPVYEWQLLEEVMISAYYVGSEHFGEGLRACEKLLGQRGHDPAFYDYVAANQVFYLRKIRALRRGTFQLEDTLSRPAADSYVSTNPSIVASGERALVNVRWVNYRQAGGRSYVSTAPDSVIRTRNALIEWEPSSDASGPGRPGPDAPESWRGSARIQGLEDVRLVRHGDQVWFTATCCEVPGAVGACRVVLGRLDSESRRVEHVVELRYAGAREVEKNWLLWSRRGQLSVVYGYDPFLVLDIDPASGACVPALEMTPTFPAARFRGSAPPLPIPGEAGRFVALVHEVVYRDSGNVYSHRFVEIDELTGLVGRSEAFVFDHTGIEYGVGLASLGGNLVVTYGFEDHEARFAEVPWPTVLEMLRPPSDRGLSPASGPRSVG